MNNCAFENLLTPESIQDPSFANIYPSMFDNFSLHVAHNEIILSDFQTSKNNGLF